MRRSLMFERLGVSGTGVGPVPGPLDDVRVIELADWIAGPFAGSLLADLGADVVKVELPGSLSNSRTVVAFEPGDDERTPDFATAARNKRSLTLDIRVPAGREVLLRLVAHSDVLVECFRPGTMERWGLGWEVLEDLNPGLVMLRISGFGQTGPWRERPGLDRVAQAFGGLTYVTGTADGPPVRAGLGVADYATGMLGAFGVMVALHERQHSGRGQQVDLALYETVLAMQGRIAVEYLRHGKVRERTGNSVADIAPGDAFRSADARWLQISAGGDVSWARLAEAMGRPELTGEERFATKASRYAHRSELDGLDRGVGRWSHGRRSGGDPFPGRGPCSPIMSIADVLTHPHVAERGNVVTASDASFGELGMIGPLPVLSRTRGVCTAPAPVWARAPRRRS